MLCDQRATDPMLEDQANIMLLLATGHYLQRYHHLQLNRRPVKSMFKRLLQLMWPYKAHKVGMPACIYHLAMRWHRESQRGGMLPRPPHILHTSQQMGVLQVTAVLVQSKWWHVKSQLHLLLCT